MERSEPSLVPEWLKGTPGGLLPASHPGSHEGIWIFHLLLYFLYTMNLLCHSFNKLKFEHAEHFWAWDFWDSKFHTNTFSNILEGHICCLPLCVECMVCTIFEHVCTHLNICELQNSCCDIRECAWICCVVWNPVKYIWI